jgi:hypothetical protein
MVPEELLAIIVRHLSGNLPHHAIGDHCHLLIGQMQGLFCVLEEATGFVYTD